MSNVLLRTKMDRGITFPIQSSCRHATGRTASHQLMYCRSILDEGQVPSSSSQDSVWGDLHAQASLPSGRLEIRPLQSNDLQAASVVLTRAFAGSDENITLSGASDYMKSMIGQGMKGLLLVAKLFPEDASLLPPNQISRIIGLVALSFHPDTMQPSTTLPTPPDSAYLSNMAVDAKFRRQGVASNLLRAADIACARADRTTVHLHVNQVDEGTFNLYSSSGYKEIQRDGGFVKLRGLKPKILMKKIL
ncbi:hypothetical protein CEUSTIGMA_g1029.t1 [Chlamydomonas eustigma]|uniref:N-acetyltransferase domain-containing protein n=1 Tax=Chlamydomonas eustigma TaxID=1157962 RepID=A0A250WRW5_9CHLO|nr:hypothetical protein CEUSTIGMA_g1029.t1 [Chlamydomonas eustigma]|eukprot:GAX73578.1 hypothetical protein CEUSTIGMA_g1029.t1 [Chlamydomonas eustigma]